MAQKHRLIYYKTENGEIVLKIVDHLIHLNEFSLTTGYPVTSKKRLGLHANKKTASFNASLIWLTYNQKKHNQEFLYHGKQVWRTTDSKQSEFIEYLFQKLWKAYEEATSETIPWKQEVKSKYHGIQKTYQTGLLNFVIYLIWETQSHQSLIWATSVKLEWLLLRSMQKNRHSI